VHVFTRGQDIPDDWQLRLVVLPLSAAWTRAGHNPARDLAQQILRSRGDQPRQKQNRVLFLAPDFDQVGRLKDIVRILLAWRSIESDIKELRLTGDNHQARQATQGREQAAETLLRLVRETFRWLVAPAQLEKRNGGLDEVTWEHYGLNPGAQAMGRELERVVFENELVIREWAPIHLHNVLKKWYWNDGGTDVQAAQVWQHMCQYLYLPRLVNSNVLRTTIAAGATSRDFFGLAYGKTDDTYQGFSFGQQTTPVMESLLLIEPVAAAAYEERTRPAPVTPSTEPSGDDMGEGGTRLGEDRGPPPPAPLLRGPVPAAPRPKRFYGVVELDPVRAKLQFAEIVDEVVAQFSALPGARVRINVDIEAESAEGFGDGTVRAAKENANTLKFRSADFE